MSEADQVMKEEDVTCLILLFYLYNTVDPT